MKQINKDDIIRLKNLTGHTVMDCNKTLKDMEGDFEAALKYLAKQPVRFTSLNASFKTSAKSIYLHYGDDLYMICSLSIEGIKNQHVYECIAEYFTEPARIDEFCVKVRNRTHEEIDVKKIAKIPSNYFIYHHNVPFTSPQYTICEKLVICNHHFSDEEFNSVVCTALESGQETEEIKNRLKGQIDPKLLDSITYIKSYV